jgi:hypothetical protein
LETRATHPWRTARAEPTRSTPHLLNFSSLYISLSSINCGDHDVMNEILCNIFFFERYEAKPTRLSCVYILQNTCINHFPVLLEVLTKLINGELEIETPYEYFASWVFERDFSVLLVAPLGLCYHIWIRFGNAGLHTAHRPATEPTCTTHHRLLTGEATSWASHHTGRLTLIVIGRFDVNFLVEDVVAADNVLGQDLILHLLGLVLICKGHLHKAESSPSHGRFVSHYDLIGNLAELREVLEQIRL